MSILSLHPYQKYDMVITVNHIKYIKTMLKFVFKPFKWFVNQNGATKALVLIIIGILGYGSFLVAEYFCGIQITSLSVQLLREGFGILLAASALWLFCIAAGCVWKEREDCWSRRDYWYQLLCFIAAASGLGFVVLAFVSRSMAQIFFDITPSLEVLWFSGIPSAIFFLIGIFTFLVKVLRKTWKSVSEYVADAWRNA